jgi:hypothetical protein
MHIIIYVVCTHTHSFKSLLSYAENPPQESAAERAQADVISSWVGGEVRKEDERSFSFFFERV